MSILRFAAAVTLAALAQTALHGEKRCPGNVPSVPLRVVQGALIVVSLSVNDDGPFDFLVDTGAQTTTVDDQLAFQLGLPDEGKTHVSGAATYAGKSFTHLAQVEAGSRRVTDVLAVIDNLAELHAADRRIRGILGEDFLAHFDLLIDNEHDVLCLDETGVMAAAMKGIRVPLAEPYGNDRDLPFMRPLVIEARLYGLPNPVLFRLDSGSNVAFIYSGRFQLLDKAQRTAQILKRVVGGAEQAFAVLQPTDVSVAGGNVRQVAFVQPINSIGAVHQVREDGVLPTQMFRRVFVSYRTQFAILDPR
jgi:predicted aspartyl protease